MLFAVVSWIYQYRNADSEVIKIDDDGFADVEIKELKMPEPPKEEPKPVEPTEVKQDPTQPKDKAPPQVAQPDKTPPKQEEAPKKPGVMDILNNIPKVDSSASNQNLTAALSNINAVRVPGGAASVKVSSLIGKAPTSGVQIGGAAGGLSTSGINSLIRKDGQAGALGGKGDHAIQGKVTTLARQLTKTGQGELSKEEIQKVINQHIGEIQFCYEKQLNKQPGLAGRVVLEWGVNPAGHVSVVKVSQSTMNSADATNCMMQKLKTWKFPPPRGGAVTIVFPFVFNTV
jgi:TonB family protein